MCCTPAPPRWPLSWGANTLTVPPDPWLDACKEADLLILDDLGTEYISQLTISVLYELINTRMLCHRPTIYTSNIVDSSIFEARYTEKVASRILGSCQIFKFFGTDQRLKRGGKR